ELDDRVFRILPRYNPRVNGYWMCDDGRLTYKRLNESRALVPLVRDGRTNALVPATWDAAVAEAAVRLRDAIAAAGPGAVAVVGSPHASTEELFLLRVLATDVLGTPRFSARSLRQAGYEDSFLIRADKNPNAAGADLVGAGAPPRELLAAV